MAKVKITGHASGTGVITVTAPNTSTDRTITLPDGDVTLGAATPSIVDGGNATAITINSSEQVGIGTASPNRALTIYGASTGEMNLKNSSADFLIQQSGHNTSIGNSSASGHINFFTNNGNANMYMDSTGAVTMPAQPAFSVASNTMQNNITVGSEVTIVYGTEVFDQNSDFTSNTFTAPVTGKYQLSATTRLGNLDSASAYYMLRIATSNRQYKLIFDPDFGQDTVYWSVVLDVLADMDAGDTATVTVLQNNGDAQTDIEGNTQYTYFTGYLVA